MKPKIGTNKGPGGGSTVQSVIGTNFERVDAPAKAMGAARYTGDYTAPGLLHVVLVRAKEAHAILLGVEIPPLEEDQYVYTAKDLAVNCIPSIMNDQPVLAENVIRYSGEPVAICAAPTLKAARKLAAAVKVRTGSLPAVFDAKAALAPNAPRLFLQGNLCSEFHSKKGNLKEATRKCAMVLYEDFTMPVQNPAFMEPESAFTYVDEQGRLALISSTQNAFSDRRTLAQVLGRDESTIHSRAATVGGGFGGKDGNTAQVYPAVVTHYTGRPAKLVFTREENIRYGMKRHSARVEVTVGFDKRGRLQVFIGRMLMDTGAYALLGPAVLGLGTEHMTGPYYIPYICLDGWLVYTNNAPASAMRGFGAPQSAIGIETVMNKAAEKLGLDPLEIRRRNAIHRGQTGPMGAVMRHSVGFEEALRQFEQSDFYKEMKEHPEEGAGYGIAAGMMSSGMGKNVPDTAYASIEAREDGTYLVRIGLVDIGQGSETVLTMIAAEALGVPGEKIRLVMADTDETADSGSTAASRSTYSCGNAILDAAKKIKAGAKKAEGVCVFPEIPEENGVHAIFGYLVQGVKIKVDKDTGAVRALWAHNTTEAGTIIQPVLMAGQVFGGLAMSTGYTLSEQVRSNYDGTTMEDSLANYILPTAMDAPHMTNDNVPFCEKSGPYGAKGVAEAATVALAPAITAAVRSLYPELTLRKLPIDREKILAAPRKQFEGTSAAPVSGQPNVQREEA